MDLVAALYGADQECKHKCGSEPTDDDCGVGCVFGSVGEKPGPGVCGDADCQGQVDADSQDGNHSDKYLGKEGRKAREGVEYIVPRL